MKTKPLILITIFIALFAGTMLFVRCHKAEAMDTVDINEFLSRFKQHARQGDTDSLYNYFEGNKNTPAVRSLVNLMAGKQPGVDTALAPHINFSDIDAEIEIINTEYANAALLVNLTHAKVDGRQSTLVLKLHKIAPHLYKIAQADARQFLTDLITYRNEISSQVFLDKDIYSPVTRQCFDIAKSLKPRYDSVIWFAHVHNKNYFYVVEGKWDEYAALLNGKDTAKTYKMGLVSDDKKEIIPVEYDLVRGIGGTFDNLVEVEKDHKRGCYDLTGKMVVPVNFDQIFPVDDDQNIAVLRSGSNYYWLKKDYTLSEKADLKIADIVTRLKHTGSFTMDEPDNNNLTEYNSKEDHRCIYLPPSYMVDLNLLPDIKNFKNPLRKHVEYDGASDSYIVKAVERTNTDTHADNWFQAAFYSIRDYFIGGRAEFYEKKNIIIVDKKRDRLLTADVQTDYTEDGADYSIENHCDVNAVRALNDTLFEVKSGSRLSSSLYDSTKVIVSGYNYHYLTVKNNKLVELPNKRTFGFTKYVKMDDSYLKGCYELMTITTPYSESKKKIKVIDQLTPEMLTYMKNEIYASYGYRFKDKQWANAFEYSSFYEYEPEGKTKIVNVADSLTAIDKYNISFINQKLKVTGYKTLAAQ